MRPPRRTPRRNPPKTRSMVKCPIRKQTVSGHHTTRTQQESARLCSRVWPGLPVFATRRHTPIGRVLRKMRAHTLIQGAGRHGTRMEGSLPSSFLRCIRIQATTTRSQRCFAQPTSIAALHHHRLQSLRLQRGLRVDLARLRKPRRATAHLGIYRTVSRVGVRRAST